MHRLNLHKYKTVGRSQFSIDRMSDDDEFDDLSSISDGNSSGSESESFPDTESTGPSESTTDEMFWEKRRAPVCGITAHHRRAELAMKYEQRMEKERKHAKPSNSYRQEQNAMYSSINRHDHHHRREDRDYERDHLREHGREHLRERGRENGRDYHQDYRRQEKQRYPRAVSKASFIGSDLSAIEEVSSFRSDSFSTSGEVPPRPPSLRSKSEWGNPPQSTNSMQMMKPLLPKTNPHFQPTIMCSTPLLNRTNNNQRLYRKHQNYGRHASNLNLNERPESTLTIESESTNDSHLSWDNPHPAIVPTLPPKPMIVSTGMVRPEQFGIPMVLAKNMGIKGIVFLSMSLCGMRLSINVQKGYYFRDAGLTQLCSYVRAELRHRSKSSSRRQGASSSSSRSHETRVEESFRTRLVVNSDRPLFQESFQFHLNQTCKHDTLSLTVYTMEADDTHGKKRILGCMTFPISRILKKAQQIGGFHHEENSENLEEVEFNNEGYFLLDVKLGEKRNLPQSKVKRQTYYNDPALSGISSASSFNSQEQMTAASSRLSVPNDLTMGDFYHSANDLRVHANPNHLNYTSASSSTNGSSIGAAADKLKFHRATLPSITTTTSENNTSDDSKNHKTDRRKVDYHYLYPENGGVYGAGPTQEPEKKGGNIRRAASFTFSPKGSSAKNNQRPFSQDGDGGKKRFLGPISKTFSYLRSKMDLALSTSSLYPSREEVRQWETCFESLLTHKFGCALFRQFLKKEFSDENVDFWLECEEFKKLKDGKKSTTQRAYEIFDQFVAEHAPKEVNLDSDTRNATKAAMENGCKSDTFTLAQNRVEQLMSKDSYRRFLRDRLFLDLVESYDTTDKEKEKDEKPSSSKDKN